MDATFFFDPACPWTWRTSRWLVTVAQARGLSIEWRAFSLSLLHGGEPPERFRAALATSNRALRLVEALRAAGRNEDVLAFYTALGTRTHDAGEPLGPETLDAAVAAAGVTDAAEALDDPVWDRAVRESHETGYASAGPDVGSPVLTLPGVRRGLHGPILSEVPGKEDALTIWDSLLPLARVDAFHEIKRGR